MEQQNRRYLGVVSGGYDDPIGTDAFKVTIPAQARLRHDRNVARWTIVSVDTNVWDAEHQGSRFRMTTLGVVEDVEIVPSHAFEDDRQMAHSDYYANEQFRQHGFSSTQEDAIRLKVRAIGHLTQDRQDLYGPVRPPERESVTYIATPDEVRVALMKPIHSRNTFLIGSYATLDGLYRPFTHIDLPSHQMFLHGAIFAASGWGKTMVMKHLLREFHRIRRSDESGNLLPPPAIVVFNIKGAEFYNLEYPLPQPELDKIFRRSPDVKELWTELQLEPRGFDSAHITYYPLGVDVRNIGQVFSFSFSQIEPDEEGDAFLRFIMKPFNLYEASLNYLIGYLFFCKRHLTDRAHMEVGHARAEAKYKDRRDIWQSFSYEDKLSHFISLLRRAMRERGVIIECALCNERFQIHPSVAEAISRALGELQRLGVFDIGSPINIRDLIRPGHISVLDVAGLRSGLAQQIFIQHVLHQIFDWANRIFLGRERVNYSGVIIFLDEAWRYFREPEVLDELEIIARMGRSLRVGLWLADQNIPTGDREWNVLNNIHTRLLGTISANAQILRKLMPLSDSMLSALPNLRRGMAILFNQEYSRMPTPSIIPPCTCYHEGD